MFFEDLKRTVSIAIRQAGKTVEIDGKEGQAIMSSVTAGADDYEDYTVTTFMNIHRGSLLKYNGIDYLCIYHTGQLQHGVYNKAYVRRCDSEINFRSDDFNFTTKAIILTKSITSQVDGVIVLPSETILVTIPCNQYTEAMTNDYTIKFAAMNKNYVVKDYDKTKDGILIIQATLVV